jgi:exosortase
MTELALARPPVAPEAQAGGSVAGRRRQTLWGLTAGIALAAWLLLWNKLRVDWTLDEQYQYGWFVPPLALALLALRWPGRPAPAMAGGNRTARNVGWLAGGCLFLLLPIRLIEEPNPDWRLFFWVHAGVLVALSLLLIYWMGGRPWLRHFSFPLAFLLLAVPWPSGPEEAIVQALMRDVAAVAAQLMNLLAIPARQQGNLILVRDQVVGVNEACSGIRSLQTMLMAGFLLGELSRLSWQRRLALLGGGLVVALAANVFRSSLLVWIAAQYGSAAMERYHDFAGVAVLLIVFAGLLWLNARLARGNVRPHAPPAGGPASSASSASSATAVPAGPRAAAARPRGMAFAVGAAAWLCCVEGGTAAWYGSREFHQAPLSRWTVALPVTAPGYQNVKIDERSTRLLRYDKGESARWKIPGPPPADCTLFFFRWEPGRTSATRAAMHQPHICLTASGLTQTGDWGIEPVRTARGVTLPVRRYEFLFNGRRIYVFYVAWQDRAASAPIADHPSGRWSRLEPVFERRRNLGQQTLEWIVSGAANLSEASAEFQKQADAMIRPL